MKSASSKKNWVKPEVLSLSIKNLTLGGTNVSTKENGSKRLS